MIFMKSYAQFDTDLYLLSLLPQTEGIYIDVGSSHPVELSNTYLFSLRGWSGIAIDPCLDVVEYGRLRPNDVALRVACGDRNSQVDFHDLNESTWSTTHLEEALLRNVPFTTREVPLRTIQAILSEAGWDLGSVDLLSIDVEGAEASVLAGCPFEDGFRPTIIVLEACRPCTEIPSHTEWEGRLIEFGYDHVGSRGVNRIYRRTIL
jgi:FkbM family methyltransferase